MDKKTVVVTLINDHCFYNDIAQFDVAGMHNSYGTYLELSKSIANYVLLSDDDIEGVVIMCLDALGWTVRVIPQEIKYLVARIEQIVDNVKEL